MCFSNAPTIIQWEQKMASAIARTSEYMTASVAVLLGLSCLVSACSSSPPPTETTGSISKTQTSSFSGTTLPPIIHAPQTTAAARPATYAYAQRRQVSYVRRQPVRRQVCRCDSPPNYVDREATGSIPQSQPAAYPAAQRFVVHTIEPNETLYSISRRYHTNVNDVAAVNRMSPESRLRFGELLVIPSR